MTFRIKFIAEVNKVEERFDRAHIGGVGRDARFENVSKGWYIHLAGSWESLYVGRTRPDLNPGDTVGITIERESVLYYPEK